MIERYRDIAARGGWPPSRGAEGLRVGSKSPAVVALRQRLIVDGRPRSQPAGDLADLRFLCRGGRAPLPGAPRPQRHRHHERARRSRAMNVPADVRLRQLEINIVRLRAYSGNLGTPLRRSRTSRPPSSRRSRTARSLTRHAAGVGKIDRQSPLMNSKVVEINFNPFWTVPASIIKQGPDPEDAEGAELPDREQDPHLQRGGPGSQPASQVNWNSDEATRYMFRQDPGGDLNSHGLRAHQHPEPARRLHARHALQGHLRRRFPLRLLGLRARAERARLHRPGSSRTRPAGTASRSTRPSSPATRIDARLAAPVPIYWIYITAWATPDGLVQFRDDIYNKDGLGSSIPVASRMPTEPDAGDVPPELIGLPGLRSGPSPRHRIRCRGRSGPLSCVQASRVRRTRSMSAPSSALHGLQAVLGAPIP